MKPAGTLVIVGGPKTDPWLGPIWRVIKLKLLAHFVDQRLMFFIASVNPADLGFLADLVREGKMRTVIDRRYPLERPARRWITSAAGVRAGKSSSPLAARER